MKNVEDIYPLTPAQQGMLFHTLYEPKAGMYVEHLSWTLKGDLNVSAFEGAWQQVINRHAILRSGFFVEGLDDPLQIVRQQVEAPMLHMDWRGLSLAEQEARLESFIQADRIQGFELKKAPLMRVSLIRLSDDTYRVIWSHHHMLLDGWSSSLALKDLFLFYRALCGRDSLRLEPVRPYSDYVAWIQGRDQSRNEAYWKETLKGFTSPTSFRVGSSPDESASNDQEGRDQGPASSEVRLSQASSAALQSVAAQNHLTLNTLAQGAWALLLSRYSGEEDVVFGSIVSGRPPELEGVESMVGLFLNALPVRAHAPARAPLITWLKGLQSQQAEARQFEYSSLAQIQNISEIPRGMPLFESTVAFENFPVEDLLRDNGSGLEIQNLIRYGSRSNYPLNVVVEPGRETLLQIGYDSRFYNADAARRMLGHYKTLLEAIAANPDRALSEFPLLTEDERRQLLFDWNETEAPYARDKCAHELFEEQVERTPDSVALYFEGAKLSYSELNARANQLARYLLDLGVSREVKVGICMHRSMEMIIAALGVLKAGAAYVPIDPDYPPERQSFILEETLLPVLLTQENLSGEIGASWTQIICLDSDWEMIAQQPATNVASGVTPDNLAYVIYTSGSTGKPKGVMIQHGSLCNLAAAQVRAFGVEENSRVLQLASFSFDASVSEIFTALSTGAALYLGARASLMPGPALAEFLSAHSITIATFPPSALAVLPCEGFPNLRTVVVAGEACPVEVANRWARDHRFINAYGPTEATVCAAMSEAFEAGSRLTIGRAMDNAQVYLLDAQLSPAPVGVPGEIVIGGVGLSRGYLDRPELTAEKFIPNPFSQQPGARLYKTGDMARYWPDGNIEFLGRNDSQVKVRGYRIELGEIQARLREHPAVREAIVTLREDKPGDSYIAAYVVFNTEQPPTSTDLRAFLLERIPDYMAPSKFVALEALPLNTSGKIDRNALPVPDAARPMLKEAYVAPRTAAEEILSGIWSQVLNVDRVGIDDNFFALGGDSIRSVQILSKAQERGWNPTLQQIFEAGTVRALAERLTDEQAPVAQTQPFSLISERDRAKLSGDIEDAYPLTRLQAGMIFHSESRPETAIYQSIISFHLKINLRADALHEAAQRVVNRHPALRTSFDMISFPEPMQLVHRTVAVPLEVEDLRQMSPEDQQEALTAWMETEKRRHFDWTRPPLLRFTVHLRAEDTFQFTFTAHHAIIDGWSDGLFLTELAEQYLSLLAGSDEDNSERQGTSSFRDFVLLEREALSSQESRRFWKESLDASALARLPRLTLRRTADAPHFGAIEIPIPDELSKNLVRLAQSLSVPLKSVLLAAHFKIMSLLTSQQDIVTGFVTNGRPEQSGSDGIIGLFVNTLPLRMKAQGDTWIDLIEAAFEAERKTLPHRRYPLAQIQIDRGGQSLFETCFNFTHFHVYRSNKLTEELKPLSSTSVTETNLALMAHFSQDPHTSLLHLSLEYDAAELAEELMQATGSYYSRTLEAIAADPQSHYKAHTPLSEQEQHQLLVEWGSNQREQPQALRIHELFEARAAANPRAIAASFEGERITYGELNRRANQLANYLRKLNVRPGELVGVCLERSIEMLVALLGALKAGAAYVPLSPSGPSDRLAFMLDDTRASVVITKERLASDLISNPVTAICLDADWRNIALESDELSASEGSPFDLAYVIYTSGTTGRPKGVQVSHLSVINLIDATRSTFGFDERDVWSLFHSYTFDFSVWEIFGCLLNGGNLVITPQEITQSPSAFYGLLCREKITILNQTPSALLQLLQQGEERENDSERLNLRLIVCGGEAMPAYLLPLARKWNVPLWNFYGPTEATVWAAINEINLLEPQEGLLPIGQPLSNTQMYALDCYLQPAPISVTGALHIGGLGLAWGYLNRPDLTAERFIPNPFSKEPGARIYNTGDLARFLPDHNIEFLGRSDHQVKLRGFRVELEEIEAALAEHPRIRESVVTATTDRFEDKRLVAYIVAADQPAPSLSELNDFLKRKLPDYMIPSACVLLESLPLTPNGKLDRQSLPAPDWDSLAFEKEYVAPRTPVEVTVAAIWAETLGVEKVGVESNLFDLGGHSLTVTRIFSRVRAAFNVDVPITSLIDQPTVAALAAEIEVALSEEADAESAASNPA
jgi:amino acid adenylation domain-containing protein